MTLRGGDGPRMSDTTAVVSNRCRREDRFESDDFVGGGVLDSSLESGTGWFDPPRDVVGTGSTIPAGGELLITAGGAVGSETTGAGAGAVAGLACESA